MVRPELRIFGPSNSVQLAYACDSKRFIVLPTVAGCDFVGEILDQVCRVSTQNNVEAEIMQGVQIPIQTIANNTVTVTWKDAALILRVLPQITASNTVIMRIVIENGSPDFSRAIQGNPPINSQRALTQVRVVNGDTTVIGGIFLSTEQSTQSRTPGLHKLPLIGGLFKRNELNDEDRELLIFITPRIIA